MALECYERGAALGSMICAGSAARLYYELGAPARALCYFERGAHLGDVAAFNNVMACYEKGIGCERDLEKAKAWMLAGVDAGSAECLHKYAMELWDGNGYPSITRDRSGAHRLWISAAEKGHAIAARCCAMVYDVGFGNAGLGHVTREAAYSECNSYLKMAANLGDEEASLLLNCEDPGAAGRPWNTHARRKADLASTEEREGVSKAKKGKKKKKKAKTF